MTHDFKAVTMRNAIVLLIVFRLWLLGVYPPLCLLVVAAEFTLIASAKTARVVNCTFWTLVTMGIAVQAAQDRALWTVALAAVGVCLGFVRISRALVAHREATS